MLGDVDFAGGVPFASHTPCLGPLVTSPCSLMQSQHCLELKAAARVSLVQNEREAALFIRVDAVPSKPKPSTPSSSSFTRCERLVSIAPEARFGLRAHRQPFSHPGLHECLLQNCGQAWQYEGIYMCDDEWGAGHAMWFETGMVGVLTGTPSIDTDADCSSW